MALRRALVLTVALASFVACLGSAQAAPPASRLQSLRRGINVTGWFRSSGTASPGAIRSYLSDAAIRRLVAAGFTFVRIPFDPAFGLAPDRRALFIAELARLERAGLAVVVAPSSADWRLESRPEDRAELALLWARLAPALRALPPGRTFPEIVNEPVFTGQEAAWQGLQTELLGLIRKALPEATVVLSGPDWSSIAGLAAAEPARDPDIVYTVHLYDPPELTALAAYRQGVDRAALARLPFPVTDPSRCRAAARSPDEPTNALIGFVCDQNWDEAAITARIEKAAAWAKRQGVPVFVGEFGATAQLNAPARLAWVAAVRAACEHAGLGWALWGYDDIMGFDLPRPPPRRPRLDPRLLKALGLEVVEKSLSPHQLSLGPAKEKPPSQAPGGK